MICTSPYKIALAASLLAASLVHAQSKSEQTLRADSLDTLETVGQIDYQTGDVLNEEETLSSVSINREQLSATPAALAEVISRETGVQYKQSGGFGSYATVSIRAASAAQTGVYLDGVMLNSGGNPVIDLSTLEILNLSSVDVYRGGTPSQLGHGGIGGSVNLNTLQADSSPGSRIRLEYGSLSQAGIQASHQVKSGKWDLVAAASRRQSDNDFIYLNKNGTPLSANDDEIQTRENAHAQRTSALLRTGYQHNANRRTDLTVQFAARELGVPEWRNLENNVSHYDTESSQLQLSHVMDGIANWNSRQGVYRHTDKNQFVDPLGQIGLGRQDTTNHLTTEGVKSYWEYPTDTGLFGVSMEYRQEKLSSDERLDNSNNYEADRNKWLASAHYTWYNASESLTITPTLRWQRNQFQGSRRVSNTQVDDANNGSELGAQLGIGFQSSDKIKYSANVGSYFRPPSFGELYGSIGLINGNPELLPEEGFNVDVGFHYSASALELSGTLFASIRDELIVTSFDSRGVGRPVNSGSAEVVGLELGAAWQISPKLRLLSNLTWQSAKSVDSTVDFFDKFLPGEAQLAWFGRAEYALNQWRTWYEIDVQNKRFYDRANLLPAADTTQHSAGIGWQTNQWQVSLSANNLSDEIVEDFNGFPKPGRTFSLMTTLSF